MKAASELEVTGIQPANAANSVSGQKLQPGWNLVGYSSSRTGALPEAFDSLDGGYDKIAAVSNGAWQTSSAADLSATNRMVPFTGYWVHSTQPAVWLSPGFRSVILDSTTGKPLAGASVSLGGIEADQPAAADGSFVVNGISDTAGQWLTVNAPGYQPFRMLVDTARQGEIVPVEASETVPFGQGARAVKVELMPAPAVGEVVLSEGGLPMISEAGQLSVPVSGFGSVMKGGSNHRDIIFVIDTSGSTDRRTAFDGNKDGLGDTVLETELYACERLLKRLKSNNVRVGVVKFARYHTKNASAAGISDGPVVTDQTRVVQELTGENSLVEGALSTVAVEGAKGGTHTAAGIDLALQAFANAKPTGNSDKDTPVRHIVLLTDGIPTLPVEMGETQENGDRQATLAAAQRALAANVQIHPVVIDSVDAERRLTTMPSVQAISGVPGGLTRVGLRNVHELAGKLDSMTFAGIDDVVVRNTGNGKSLAIPTSADGSFNGVIPVQPGTNYLEFKFTAVNSTNALTRHVCVVVQTNAPMMKFEP